ncbi:putative acyl-CoA synthetase YngI [Mercenaria mercenaria]|uniref:putative acyl-CoA synthetase YngI n=1 Tax=Mercenaria mercenaria TaxID=6596 RepID=UPI00234F8E37|nr:putative acyl-CoA synthetase YngI [Mercenaria mercenaria]
MERNLSYIHRPVDFQYHYETVPERLHGMAERHGDKEVYVFLHPDGRRESITAEELYKKSRQLAHSLLSLGIGKGDIVATCLYNDLDLLICTLGVICTGAIILNVLIKNEDGSDLHSKLKDLDVKCLILEPGDDHKQLKACMNFIPKIDADGSVQSPKVPALKWLISTSTVNEMQMFQLRDCFKEPGDSFQLPKLDPEATMLLFPTSGSTGESKFVPHSHHDAMLIGHHLKESIGYDTADVMYCERRIAWIGGFPFMFLHDALKVVTKTKPFSTLREHCEFTYKVIQKEGCTVAGLLPSTVIGLVDMIKDLPEKTSSMLKNIHTGGLPVDSACMNAIGILTETVTNVYGSSEGGFFAANPVKRKENYLNYCSGKPLAGFELKVVNDEGFVVEREKIGLIFVRSPCLFRYYYKNETKTKEVLSSSHWMNTDDVGYITNDGQLVVSGRKSDIILQSGKYMFPSKIEAFIKNHPDVLDVLVISVPDAAKFELVCACVIPLPGKTLTPDDIERFYAEHILAFANEAFSRDKPEIIMIFKSFPPLYTGKPDKRALKEEVLRRLQKK